MSSTTPQTTTEPNPWHQLFGVIFVHQTAHLPYTLEVDYNVDRTEQRIDILLRKDDPKAPQPILPDGFENLRVHNLFSFKSFQETMSLFTIYELLMYGLLYRKMQAPKGDDILSEDEVSLFAVSTRSPRDLFKTQRLDVNPVTGVTGVYDVWYGPSYLRLIVIQELALEARNANFFLFSSREDQVKYAQENHNLISTQFQFAVSKLLARFNTGGLMPKLQIPTLEEVFHEILQKPEIRENLFKDEAIRKEAIRHAPKSERLEGVSAAERLEGLSQTELEELAKLIAQQTNPPKAGT